MFCDFKRSFNNTTALYEIPTGNHVTYAELDALINTLHDELFKDQRLLVFIAITNSIASITFYLACLRARCPVYLFDPSKNVDELIQRYNPNVIAHPDSQSFVKRHQQPIPMENELALLLSTSGSTGTPKFVKLSRQNINSNAESIAQYLDIDVHHRALAHLKLFYSYGLSVLHSHLAVGASLYLSNDAATDDAFWQSIQQLQITSFAGVPFTFQSLRNAAQKLGDYPSLKYLSQAGGKLSPEDVVFWANECEQNGMAFFVMYGQTEAAPRIAYLPPHLSRAYPDCIGVAIPGGTLSLVDSGGNEIHGADIEGELCYQGPNVMMGYAETIADLATASSVKQLLTGDIARRNAAGLYKIVGRQSRFVKLLGIRINLDDIERQIDALCPGSVCTGDDERIILAGNKTKLGACLSEVAHKIGLPDVFFVLVHLEEIPRLSNGKVDYSAIKALASNRGMTHSPTLRSIFSYAFFKVWLAEVVHILGFGAKPTSVREIYGKVLGIKEADLNTHASFKDYGGDSIKYVSVSIEIESLFGYLPENWEDQPIKSLESTQLTGAM